MPNGIAMERIRVYLQYQEGRKTNEILHSNVEECRDHYHAQQLICNPVFSASGNTLVILHMSLQDKYFFSVWTSSSEQGR